LIFENDDDFGIDIFREDIWENVASNNSIKVGLIKRNEDKSEDLQGDFLGIQTNNYQETIYDIRINLNSYSPQALKLKKQGYDSRGEIKFGCVAKYNVDVKGDDLIVFYDDYESGKGLGLKAGQVFKIEMGESGLYQGQYCWKEFDIVLIRENGWQYKGEKLTTDIETQTDIVDALTEGDYTSESWTILTTAYDLPFRTNPEGYKKLADLISGIAGLEYVIITDTSDFTLDTITNYYSDPNCTYNCVKITSQINGELISVVKDGNCDATTATILDSTRSLLETISFSGNTATFGTSVSIVNGGTYYVGLGKAAAVTSYRSEYTGASEKIGTNVTFTGNGYNNNIYVEGRVVSLVNVTTQEDI